MGAVAGVFDLPDLDGWVLHRDDALSRSAGPWTWTDDQGTFLRRPTGSEDGLVLRAEGIASAHISFYDRRITLHGVAPRADEALLEQFVSDQVLPRLLSHLGRLVVHAGAVEPELGRTILFVAPSGYGKSTLTGYLHDSGWPLLGDDAILLHLLDGSVIARSVYRRLKLLPDSFAWLFPTASSPAPRIGRKVSIEVSRTEMVPALAGEEQHSVAALFFLSKPPPVGGCQVERIAAAEACIYLVRSSFALDPTDVGQAGRRFLRFGAVANTVPSFRLAYRRDFGQLAQVRDAIRSALNISAASEAQ